MHRMSQAIALCLVGTAPFTLACGQREASTAWAESPPADEQASCQPSGGGAQLSLASWRLFNRSRRFAGPGGSGSMGSTARGGFGGSAYGPSGG